MSENKKQNAKKTETKRGNLISRKPKKRFSQTKNLPVEQVLHLQQTIGNRAVTRLFQSGAIQAKLKIGKPNDIYEKEADSVANKVMSMSEPKQSAVNGQRSSIQRESAGEEEKEGVQTKTLAEQITPLIRRQADEEEKAQTKPLIQRQKAEEEEAQAKPLIQRQAEEEEKPAQTKLLQRQEGEEEKEAQTKLQRQAEEEDKAQTKPLIQRQAEEEEKPAQTTLLQRQEGEEEKEAQTKLQRQAEEEEKPAQTKAAPNNTPEVTPNIESNINSMKGGGQPLSESTRSFFEPRFGADFSQVRVHNDSRAANTAQSINAKAFTTGKDIVFNKGQYSPGTSAGRRLVAHELTHVVQQSKASSTPHRLANISKDTNSIFQKPDGIFLTGNSKQSPRFPDEMTLSIIRDSTLGNNIINRRGTFSGDNRGRHFIDGRVTIENETYIIRIYGQKTCGTRNYSNICVYHTIDQISLRCSRTDEWRHYPNLSEDIKGLKIANVSESEYDRLFPRRR